MFSEVLRQAVLGLTGLSAGGVIAAGVFAFLAIIGVFPRMIGTTKTNQHILLYETVIVSGGVIGNVLDIYEFPVLFGGSLLLGIFGFSVGVFVGCLVMSLAETLKAMPVMNRRIHLAVGFQYVILALAVGKMIGSLIYFMRGMSA
ncbi:MAG: stage V sporulation protein AB [Lachnospiraceae bacterium]|nr:stage V sporulation protein AB [Lachnospiraceae bacterium]